MKLRDADAMVAAAAAAAWCLLPANLHARISAAAVKKQQDWKGSRTAAPQGQMPLQQSRPRLEDQKTVHLEMLTLR